MVSFKRIAFPLTGLILLLAFAAPGWSSEPGVMALIKEANEPYTDVIKVPLPADAVAVKEKDRGGRFYTRSRKDKIQRFNCSACHNNKPLEIKDAAKLSHADIKVAHGGESGPTGCYTCHSKENRDYLNTDKDRSIDMDHVYTLCGQCHFRQKKDWVGGAHGRPESHWAGERVVKNCTACHDPHTPRFKAKWPATYSPPFN
ncbi:MAG: hypothetical protein MI802_05600 [Desulfobacterales bacterium]|nr:hypothetical protein [Desulfobacterales bacterium]